MTIRIETKKEIVRGEQRRLITKIDMLEEYELPWTYCEGESVVGETCCGISSIKYATEGAVSRITLLSEKTGYSGKTFAANIEIVKQCGNRLSAINRRLAKENAGWEGIETFII